MFGRSLAWGGAALAFLLLAGQAAADTVVLSNGDRITGDIVHLVGGKLTVKTAWAGEIQVDWAQVVSVASDKELPVILRDKSQLVGKVVAGEGGRMVSETALGTSPMYDASDVVAIAPPPPPPYFRYKGSLSLTGKITDGNANTKAAGARGFLETRVEKQRMTLNGRWDYAENEGELAARNTFGSIKLDYFFTEKFYSYALASFEGDKFKDLDLRSTFGAGVGYQWVDEEDLSFYTEGGLSYVVEDRHDGQDTRDLSLRAAWRLDWQVVPDRVAFFHFAEVYPSAEDKDDVFAHIETGIRTRITEGWQGLLQVDFDWDNTPAPGRGRKDVAYLIGLGYTFGN